MKKILIGLSAATFLFSFGAAMADEDAATLFQTRCQACHGPDGGRPPVPGITPIKGRSSEDILKMLEGFQHGTFGGAQKQVMEGVTHQLTEDQMKALADYVSKL